MDGWFDASTLLAAVGCGLNGGVFFAFSAFVMPALGRLPAAQGTAAMRAINVAAVTAPFMAALFGTALACLALMVVGVARWGEAGAGWLVLGGGLYLVGTIGVTIVYHVPRNDALAVGPADGPEGAARWAGYVPGWTAWNSVRAAAGLAAAAALTAALVAG